MTARRLLSWLVLPPLLLAVGWLAGFVWFLHIANAPAAAPPMSDGIVALTGGAERVEAALRLLAEGRAPRLLISGVGGAADFHALSRGTGVDPALAARVTLGRAAASTRGNALETASWARAHGVRTLIVVTAGYHMPRARAELSRALPDVDLTAYPVQPPGIRQPGIARLRLLAGEYTKYLTVVAGFGDVLAHGDPERGPEASNGGRVIQ